MSSKIQVAEQFASMQGEGRYAGVPAIFLRVSGCNLHCGVKKEDLPDRDAEQQEYKRRQTDDATWTCDTLAMFRPEGDLYEPSELASEWSERGFLRKIEEGAHIVLTGGEPTVQGRQLAQFVRDLEASDPFVEVETNGTIRPDPPLEWVTDQFNVSIKLSNSGMPEERRLNWDAIEWHADNPKSDFKFVVGREDDVSEILEIVQRSGIDKESVYLMPAGYSQDDLRTTVPQVAELCTKYGFRYSPRIHVNVWDQAVGV